MTFQTGELDQLINFVRPESGSDGLGGKTDVVQNVIATNVWAKRRPLSGKEFTRYDAVNNSAMCAFVIRYRDDLLPTDQIYSDGIYYNIRFIPPVSNRSMYLVIEAESGVAS